MYAVATLWAETLFPCLHLVLLAPLMIFFMGWKKMDLVFSCLQDKPFTDRSISVALAPQYFNPPLASCAGTTEVLQGIQSHSPDFPLPYLISYSGGYYSVNGLPNVSCYSNFLWKYDR